MSPGSPAVFLDKDGTLVDDVPYNVDPEQIRLASGADRLGELVTAGYKLVIVSNQSGVARGFCDEQAVGIAICRLAELLRDLGAPIAGSYYCPHHPNGSVESYSVECECRKPRFGLLTHAARELDIDLHASWMVGDILNDVEAGRQVGCRTVHIDCGNETEWLLGRHRIPHRTVSDLGGAVDAILVADRERRSQRADTRWSAAKNVLCVRLDTLGDVLMTTPAIRAIKQALADRNVTLLTSSVGAQVANLVQEIDDVIVYDAPWMKGDAAPEEDEDIVDKLRARRFDAAVLFSVYSQNVWAAALMCRLAGIPLSLGHSRENPYHLLTEWAPELEPQKFVRHEVQRQLELVERVGVQTDDVQLSLHVSDNARQQVHERLRAIGLDPGRPWALIHPGSSAASRRYPAEGFAAVAGTLVREDGWQICFSGDPGEVPLVDAIRKLMDVPSYSLAGSMELEELAALIGEARLLITNNTGPAHIAAALGTPQVVLYALTNPQHMPWASPARVLRHDVPCRNCYRSVCPEGHHDCLRMIRPEEVARAAREMMAIHHGGSAPETLPPTGQPITPARL